MRKILGLLVTLLFVMGVAACELEDDETDGVSGADVVQDTGAPTISYTHLLLQDPGTNSASYGGVDPGADIDAIFVERGNDTVHSGCLDPDWDPGDSNRADMRIKSVGEATLDLHDATNTEGYLALGNNGELTCGLQANLATGDKVIVYEVGYGTGGYDEEFKISVGQSADGPWTALGTAVGSSAGELWWTWD